MSILIVCEGKMDDFDIANYCELLHVLAYKDNGTKISQTWRL